MSYSLMHPRWTLVLVLLVTLPLACGAKTDDPRADDELVAGGQSGTDSTGSGYCALQHDQAFEIGFQHYIELLDITPYEALARVHGRRALIDVNLTCGSDDTSLLGDLTLLLDVRAGETARIVPGRLITGSSEELECEAVELDVDARISSADGSVDANASLLRLWPMRLRAIGDMVFQGTSLVDVHFDLRDFAERDRNENWPGVDAFVYSGGTVDENGWPIPDDWTRRHYRDVGYSCRGFAPDPDQP